MEAALIEVLKDFMEGYASVEPVEQCKFNLKEARDIVHHLDCAARVNISGFRGTYSLYIRRLIALIDATDPISSDDHGVAPLAQTNSKSLASLMDAVTEQETDPVCSNDHAMAPLAQTNLESHVKVYTRFV